MVASWHWKDIVETIKKHYPEYSVPPSRVPSRMSDGAGSQGDAAEVSTGFVHSVARLPKFGFFSKLVWSNLTKCLNSILHILHKKFATQCKPI